MNIASTTSRAIPIESATASVQTKRMALHRFAEPLAYADAWDLQRQLHQHRVSETGPDTLLMLEHRPVYTMGPRTRLADWGGNADVLRATGADVVPVNRGGSVTYHGPGQVILYPILRMTDYAQGVRDYVRQLEELVITGLNRFGIVGERRHRQPGVWVATPQESKIAALGIRVEKGVTLHGVAVNVDLDLAPFARITPCGLAGCRVTSMSESLGRPVSVSVVQDTLAELFCEQFSVAWIPPSPDVIHSLVRPA